MNACRPVIIAAAFLVSLLPALAQAVQQQGTLPVTPGAGKYLPEAAEIGEGWVGILEAGIAPGPELFAEGVKAVYGGPTGSRAVVYVWLTREGDETTRRAWQAAAEFMGSARNAWGSHFPDERANELATLPPPDGCAEAARAEGIDASTTIPVGLTLCAVDPDVLILTIVSGPLNGETGILASDALLQTARVTGDG